MASVNKVILVGNVGRDPELRYMNNGNAVANVSIATTSKRTDKNTNETIEDTQWHRVVFYDKLADIVGKYVKKGSAIYIEGRLKYGKYTDKDGAEKYTTDIIALEMQMLGDKSQASQAPRQEQRPAPAQRPASGFDDMNDDVPF